MKGKILGWAAGVGTVLVLALGAFGLAQDTPPPMHLSGLISDYTPETINNATSGPWEVRGLWSLNLGGESGTADFSAALTMVRSDEGVLVAGGGFDPPTWSRHPHTHHITLVNGEVVPIPNNPNGFRVTGAAIVTGNGNFPPDFGGTSSLQIDVTGGTGPNSVRFSNIAVTFIGDAAKHFGSQPIRGVVRRATGPESDNSQ